MFTVHKFPLGGSGVQVVAIRGLVKLLTVQAQRNTPCLWALVDDSPGAAVVTVRLVTVRTGGEAPAVLGEYLGTLQLDDGWFVGHVFVEGRP